LPAVDGEMRGNGALEALLDEDFFAGGGGDRLGCCLSMGISVSAHSYVASIIDAEAKGY
jgi:hypothetical protein